MTLVSSTAVAVVKESTRISGKVCMHFQEIVRTDPRLIRSAAALTNAGFAASIVDIEGATNRPATEDIAGICLKHVVMPGWYVSTPFPWSLIKAAWMFIRTTLRLMQTPADIYHAVGVPALPACYIVAQLRRKPLIFDAIELPLSEMPLSVMSRSRRSIHSLLTWLLLWIVPRCAGILVTSPYHAREMCKRYHVPAVTVVRNVPVYKKVASSNRLRKYLGLSPQTRIVLYQGQIYPDRELDRVVRAAAFLQKNIVIVMMGKACPATVTQLDALIAQEGVADRVKIIPPVPYAELLEWTASANIGLTLFSPDYSPHMKTCLPNKLFEYLMAGLPVLSSELDAVGEIIRTYEVGHIVSSLTPEAIAAGINAMLADRDLLARMRHNALRAAQYEFNWEKESLELIHLYNNILRSKV